MKHLLILWFLLAGFVAFASAEIPFYPIGEQLFYKILWGFIPVGQTTITCEQIEENDTPFIRIRVEAKSNRLVSTLYPVNDRIDCFVDPETGFPVRVEKKTSEGGRQCDDTLWLDHKNQRARWESRSDGISTNYPIHPDTLDTATFLYALRSAPFTLNKSQTFDLAVDAFLHSLTITACEKKKIKTELQKEKIPCTRFSVVPKRDDLFVYKAPGDIWVTDNLPRVMIKMKTKTPLGNVRIILDEIRTLP